MPIETKKQRHIRFAMIFFFLTLVVFSFLFQKNQIEKRDFNALMLTVIETKDEKADYPLVSMVKYQNQTAYLINYKVIPENNYKFETYAIKKLPFNPERILSLGDGEGVWVLGNNDWKFYNTSLKEIKNKTVNHSDMKDRYRIPFSVKKISQEGTFDITIKGNNQERLRRTFSKQPLSIHSLSKEKDVLLITFKHDVVVYKK